jgi:uncharacterized protein (TIGR03435 family)
MIFPAFWNEAWTSALVNHLWQSTAVALLAWLLAWMLRSNQARTRYWLWMIASVKFLLPFSILIAAGESLRYVITPPVQSAALDAVMSQLAQPFPQTVTSSAAAPFIVTAPAGAAHYSHLLPLTLVAVWLIGFFVIAFSWTRRWWQLRAVVRNSFWMTSTEDVPVLSTPHTLEPGIFGILRPVLLLPASLIDRLSAPQLRAVIAHEICHVRRRDNLTAALHMVVQAVFWFYPPVWWIKTRLLEERERACDEAVLESGNQAEIYAESILNVCKFCVESPLACLSGITGSDLKRRILRIMTEQVARKLDCSRKLLLSMAAIVAVAAPIVFGLVHITHVSAQSTAPNAAKGIADTWQGTLHAGRDLRIVFKITKADDGTYKAVNYSIDQGGMPIPVKTVTLDGATVKMSVTAVDGTYEGKLSADGNTIVGNWSQGSSIPLTLTRATPETEWAIPKPPPPIPPMDANASPSFEVATIKPGKPDAPGKGFRVMGRRFTTLNTSLSDLISFAYGVHNKQVIGAPDWAATDKFDIDAVPDGEGAPSDKQWKGMVQKLLAERFQFTFHRDKRELSVYGLSVAKGGPKLTKSEGDPNGLPALFFRGKLGDLNVRNANMDDFAGLMQSAVLDRPVVNQTELVGRYDFTLNWTPDDSQFSGMGAKIPPPTDSADAPPNLYTAIQEQMGLKLDATKAPAEVLVIDKVEKPSAN